MRLAVFGNCRNIRKIDPEDAGLVILHMTENVPSGYLIADGSAYSRQQYKRLYSLIGVMYGDGDGYSTFNIPDMRGYFPRFQDDGAGRDPDASSRTDRGDGTIGDNVGTTQDSEFASHTHSMSNLSETLQIFNPARAITDASDGKTSIPWGMNGVRSLYETRAKNMCFLGAIKY